MSSYCTYLEKGFQELLNVRMEGTSKKMLPFANNFAGVQKRLQCVYDKIYVISCYTIFDNIFTYPTYSK